MHGGAPGSPLAFITWIGFGPHYAYLSLARLACPFPSNCFSTSSRNARAPYNIEARFLVPIKSHCH